MAHITYYFQRDKNKYEQIWDYNEKLTKWISFITNWFWITDVTEITSNKRNCPVGINSYYFAISVLYILSHCLEYFKMFDISNYWYMFVNYALVLAMIIIPCFKLMFKFSFYYIVLSWLFFNLFAEDLNWLFYSLASFIVINVLGWQFNNKYLKNILTLKNKGFELTKVEINKYSCYYLYNKLLNKNIKQIETKLRDDIK